MRRVRGGGIPSRMLKAFTKSPHRKRFHLFRLVLILLIVLTLGLITSSHAAEITLGEFIGFYKPSRFIVDESIQLPDTITMEEIQLRVEASSNSLLNTVTKSSKNAEIGKPFLAPLTNVGGVPKVEVVQGSFGCHVITRLAKIEGAKIVMTIEDVYRFACGITLSKKISSISLSRGDFDGEIQFTAADKRGKTTARYIFKRN